MAIKFSFTLNDAEAENLFSWLDSERTRLMMYKLEEIEKGEHKNNHRIRWYDEHMEYMKQVQARMLQSQERLPDSPEFDV